MSDNSNVGRRKFLTTSGVALAGGVTLSSMTSTAKAEESFDLNNDFEKIQTYVGGSTKDGMYVDVDYDLYRPYSDTGLDRDGVRVGRAVIEIGAEGPSHNYAKIKMDGYNDATLLEGDNGKVAMGPESTIGSSTYTLGFSATSGGSISVGTDTSVSVEAASTVSRSESSTESNLDINNYTELGNELFKNEYDFNDGLRDEFVSIDATAAFNSDGVAEWDDCIDFTWEVDTTESTVNDTITYSHVEGDLS
ncbi:hypothetical protein [Halorussus pelagicus]|uniref:hypothetical protein n=1 Tax=Halorussus pelagicus TaxID=2505977 RepID=UPI000FFC1539|nr:hypothetical protein [Halorussus pelagicus]